MLGASQTWSPDLPYDDNQVVVPATGTLTLNPGTIVKESPDEYPINYGILNVEGTAANPVYFTSYKDDSVGGDTNGDGASSTPSQSDWEGIATYSGATTTISNAIIRYGGNQPAIDYAELYLNGGTLTLNNSQGASSGSSGGYVNGGPATISSSELSTDPYGAYIASGIPPSTLDSFRLAGNSGVDGDMRLFRTYPHFAY